MDIDITEGNGGLSELVRDGVVISSHRQEREAIQKVLKHAKGTPSGVYELRRPVIRFRYTAPPSAPPPPPPAETGTISGGGEIQAGDSAPWRGL